PAVPQQVDRAPAVRAAERELTGQQPGEVPQEIADVLALQQQELHGAQPVVPLLRHLLEHASASSAGVCSRVAPREGIVPCARAAQLSARRFASSRFASSPPLALSCCALPNSWASSSSPALSASAR